MKPQPNDLANVLRRSVESAVESGPWVLASRANYNASQPLRRLKRSPLLRLKLPHVLHQPLHALDRHGVVDRRAHAADRAVAFELHHAARCASSASAQVTRVLVSCKRLALEVLDAKILEGTDQRR